MRTINRNDAHRDLVTSHKTMLWQSDLGRVSVRKTSGKYCVRVENYETGQVFKNSYATLPGALVNAETMREFYL